MKKLPRTLGLAILTIACTLLAACTPYGDMCVKKMDCEGGNDADYDECMLDFETNEDLSSVYGCEALWDRYLECREFKDRCDGDNWTDKGECATERKDFRDCAGEVDIW